MRLGLVATIVVGAVIASLPVVVNNVSNLELSNSVTVAPSPVSGVSTVGTKLSSSTQATASLSISEGSEVPEIVGSGCVTSSSGPDKLVVCPTEVYVSEVGTEVKVVATVYFRHVPCKYGRWSLSTLNTVNATLVKVDGPKVSSDGSKAVATYYFKVLGNGSVTIVYRYNCPYGSEEVVKVRFYVVNELPKNVGTQTPSVSNNELSTATTELSSTKDQEEHEVVNISLSGEVINKSVADQYLTIATKVYIKGEWICGNETLSWEDVIKEIKEGVPIKLIAEEKSFGLKAVAIELGSRVCYLKHGGHEESTSVTTEIGMTVTNVTKEEGEELSVGSVKGKVEEVSNDYVVVNGVKVYFRGKWVCNGEFLSRWDVISMFKVGDEVSIKYEVRDWGNKAIDVVINGIECSLANR